MSADIEVRRLTNKLRPRPAYASRRADVGVRADVACLATWRAAQLWSHHPRLRRGGRRRGLPEVINDVLADVETEVRRSFLDEVGRAADDVVGPVAHLISARGASTRRATLRRDPHAARVVADLRLFDAFRCSGEDGSGT